MSNKQEDLSLDEILKVFGEVEWREIFHGGSAYCANINGLSVQMDINAFDNGSKTEYMVVRCDEVDLVEYSGDDYQEVSDLYNSVKKKFDDNRGSERKKALCQARRIIDNILKE